MLTNFLAALRDSTAKRRGPAIALIVTIGLLVFLSWQGSNLPGGAISLQRACDCDTATSIVQSWDELKPRATVQVLLDFPFIAAYAYLLFAFGNAVARKASPSGQPRFAELATYAGYAGLFAGCLDVVENFGLLTMIWVTTHQPLPLLTWLASSVKFALIAISVVASIVALLAPYSICLASYVKRLLGVGAPAPTKAFKEVFESEYQAICARDSSRPTGRAGGERPTVENGLIGLALSGGGIRSAAFALGGLQALNAAGVLARIHYLSTVSGGGYIGTAMTVGMSTDGAFPYGKTGQDIDETPPTQWLRDHSRYLVQNGVTSVVSALAIYLRGIVANMLIVFPPLLALAAAFLYWRPQYQTLTVRGDWICPFTGLSDSLNTLSMPRSLIALAITAGLLAFYAVVVSVSPIISLNRRRLAAACASVILCLAAAVVLYELHCLLLDALFHNLAKPAKDPGTDVFSYLLSSTKALIAIVVASLGGIFPFIKRIANAAVSDKQTGVSNALKRWGSRALLIVAAAIMPLLLWLLLMQLIFWGTGLVECVPLGADSCGRMTITWAHAPGWLQGLIGAAETQAFPSAVHPWLVYAVSAALIFAVACLLSVNANSLHQLYRDRLGSAFLGAFEVKRKVKIKATEEERQMSADTFWLHEIDSERCPYHIINAALNVPGSSFANARGRNADFFIFSKNYSGSEMTGYVDTRKMEEMVDGLNIGTAMAISGAAAAPNMGMASMRPLSSTIAFMNIRLGRWVKHPQGIVDLKDSWASVRWWLGTPGLTYLLREAFSKSGADLNPDGFLFLTDGGHIENLGVYALLRRRCKIIIAIDGEADPDLDGGSLVQLERFARIDLGTTITMDWKGIGAMTRKVSEDIKAKKHDPQSGPHVALGLISYPGVDGGPRESGLLVYVKASLSGDENDYVMNYKATNASFPHETTLDQLFSEEQFECYRALGEHIMRRFLSGDDRASPNARNRWDLVKIFNETVGNATIA